LLIVSSLTAQEVKQRQRQAEQADPSRQIQTDRVTNQSPSANDAILANCLIIDNSAEVVLAQLALQRAQNAQVKEFAKQTIQDHGEFVKALQRFAGQTRAGESGLRQGDDRSDATQPRREGAQPQREGTELPRDRIPTPETNPRSTAANRPDAERPSQPGTPARSAPGEQPAAGGRTTGVSLDLVGLKRELSEKCVQTARRELEGKTGAEFDKCYANMQVWSHLHAIDTMEVYQNYASPELRQVVSQGTQIAKKHLQSAKELAKQLDDGASAETARRATK
jgi:predicted outer membrane protein